MGACVSCDTSEASPALTTKLILPDGELREYPNAVRVADVLRKDPEWFVCDADEMEFDGFVSALGPNEELRPGQLYFVLARSALRQPLRAEDLASLAVKASEALIRAAPGGGRPGRRAVAPLVFAAPETKPKPKPMPKTRETVPAGAGLKRRRPKAASFGGRRTFMPDLIAIPE